jgi:hypothetical protein
VVEMDLGLAEAGATQFRHAVHVFGFVLVLWDEKRVTGRMSVAILEVAEEPRILRDPAIDALAGEGRRRLAQFRLVVVRDT